MARKRVNKNLVAFLTVMGILLTVIVVALATSHGARKDPRFWEAKAVEQREAGDLELAMNYFDRAYRASKPAGGGAMDVTYLVKAAECALQIGEVYGALGTLDRARAEQPRNKEVLVAFLGILWDLFQPEQGLDPVWRTKMLEYAEALREVDPEDVLGPLSVAVARWAMVENRADLTSAEWAAGDDALKEAEALSPDDPRVVRARIALARRLAQARIVQAQKEGARQEQLEEINHEFAVARLDILRVGVEACPGDRHLVELYAHELEAQGKYDEARKVMEQALAAREDDPDLQFDLARILFNEGLRNHETLSAEDYAALLTRATTHAERAIELERALYRAWMMLGQIALFQDYKEGEDIQQSSMVAALRVYDDAINQTVGVHSLHAVFGSFDQRRLYAEAYQTALRYFRAASGEAREQRREWVEKFLDATETRYRDEALAHFLRGSWAAEQNKLTEAAQAFEKAQARAEADTTRQYPRLWFAVFGDDLPVQHLAALYRRLNQPGESLRYTEAALQEYATPTVQSYRRTVLPPLSLVLNRAELLNTLGRSQEARDYVAEVRRDYADELANNEVVRVRLAAVEANTLQREGREGDARTLVTEVEGGGLASLLTRAYAAQLEDDALTAIDLYDEALHAEELRAEKVPLVLRLLMPVLVRAEQQERGLEILAGVRQRFSSDAQIARVLGQYELLLADLPPEEYDVKLRELIAAEPDPTARANAWVSYYSGRGEWEKVLTYLDELEEIHPEDGDVLANQFQTALRLKRYDRAARYVAMLSRLDADHAGGATYRGRLALAQDEPETAVREFRAARDILPRTSALQVALARALLAAGRFDEAAEALEEGVQLNPLDFNAHKLLYIAYQNVSSGRRPADGGVSHLLAARELRPNDPFIRERAEYLDEEADPRAGITKREQRRSEAPDDVPNLIRLAQLYAKTGDEVRATECFQQALKVAPENGDLALAATRFYAAAGRRADGEQHVRAYLGTQSGRERGFAYVLLAKFYERLGDLAAAEAAYQDAKRVIESDMADAEERREALLSVAFELVEFYRRSPQRDEAMIDACRWAMDKLRAGDARDDARRQYARLTVIHGLLTLGRFGDAEKDLMAYRQDYAEDVNGLIAEAQLRLSQRELTKAYALLDQVLRVSPNHVWSLLTRGRLSVRYGKYTEARDDLLRARQLLQPPRDDPEVVARWRTSANFGLHQVVCSELAGLYEVMGRNELAEAELRQILEFQRDDPGSAEAASATVNRLLALFRRTGQFDKGKLLASEFMNKDPNSPMWPQRYASVCVAEALHSKQLADEAAEVGKRADEDKYRSASRSQYEVAVDYFQRAERLAQPQSFGLFMRCLAFRLDAQIAMGQAAQAVQVFEQLQAQTQQVPAIVRASVIRGYATLNRTDEALAQLEAGLEIGAAEGASTLQAVVGFSLEYLSREQVVAALRRVSERTPAESVPGIRLRNSLAAQLVAGGDPDEALGVLAPALANTTVDPSERVVTQLLQAQALDETGKVPEAIRVLENVVEVYPTFATALNNLAFMLADKAGRPQEALTYAEAAYEQEARNPNLLDTVGWVYFKNGMHDQAEVTLRQALNLDPENLPATTHLGLMLLDRGRTAEARNTLRRAQTLAVRNGNEQYQQQIQEALDRLP